MARSLSEDTQHFKAGYFEQVAAILHTHNHPIVLLEESAVRWMGQRVSNAENIDLLIRNDMVDIIASDLLATKEFEMVEQLMSTRLNDPYVNRVPRIRGIGEDHAFHETCLNLWSEDVVYLDIKDLPLIEVPGIFPWNPNIVEARFDPVGDQTVSISYESLIAKGVKITPDLLDQRPEHRHPIYVPTPPRLIDSLLDRYQYCTQHPELYQTPAQAGKLASYHLSNFIRYLYLELPYQRRKVIPELAQSSRAAMISRLDRNKRKPVVTLAGLLASAESNRSLTA